MSLSVRRLSYALGAEIRGIDLSGPLSNSTMAAVREAWLEHQVLLFPDQHISPAQQAAFGRLFGPLDTHRAANKDNHPDAPEVWVITNRPKADGTPSETRDIGRMWHSDHSFTTRPTMATMLYCLEVPEVGGNTLFTNMYMAYDALSEGMKRLLDGLEAVHSYSQYLRNNTFMKQRNAEQVARHERESPPVLQPVVRTHPETGRKALYVTEGNTSRFSDMTEEESRDLLEFLFRHSTRPEFTYRHAWAPRHVLMWDNRCTAHLAPLDYDHNSPGKRLMHRVTVEGSSSGRPCQITP